MWAQKRNAFIWRKEERRDIERHKEKGSETERERCRQTVCRREKRSTRFLK